MKKNNLDELEQKIQRKKHSIESLKFNIANITNSKFYRLYKKLRLLTLFHD